MTKPDRINILGVEYTITFTDKPSEVDIFKRHSYWGQVDHWTRTIRVYKGTRPEVDLWQTIFHEMIHAIATELHIVILNVDENNDEPDRAVDLLATGLVDMLFRNGYFTEG